MTVLVKLSGDHPTMPLAETAAICCIHPGDATDLGDRIILIPSGDATRIASRAGLSHWAGDVIGEGEAITDIGPVDIGGATFRLDVKGCPEGEMGPARAQAIKLVRSGTVNLDSPTRRLILHRSDRWRLLDIHRQPRGFSARTPIRRPFFTPVSIMPRFARALVNMSRTPDGGSLLDPMCGTGGLLIEGGLLGYRLLASDIDPRMVAGTERNLSHFGLKAQERDTIPVAEAAARFGRVDGIVTDPPYGKASTTAGRGKYRVLEDALETFSRMLSPGGGVSLAVPDTTMLEGWEDRFVTEESHPMRIHGTLTRHFTVLRRR